MEDDIQWHEDEEGLPPPHDEQHVDAAHDAAKNAVLNEEPDAQPVDAPRADAPPHERADAAPRDEALDAAEEHNYTKWPNPAISLFFQKLLFV